MIGPDLNKICNEHLQREFANLLTDAIKDMGVTKDTFSISFRISVDFVNGEPVSVSREMPC